MGIECLEFSSVWVVSGVRQEKQNPYRNESITSDNLLRVRGAGKSRLQNHNGPHLWGYHRKEKDSSSKPSTLKNII